MDCFMRKIASIYGLIFSSFDDQLYLQRSFTKTKYKCKATEETKLYQYQTDHTIPLLLSLSFSLALIKTHFNYRYGCCFFHIVHKDSFTVFIIFYRSRFCCPFRHTLSDTFYLISLALFLSHSLFHFFSSTLAHNYNVLLASIDYNNNCIYIYKPFFFRLDTHSSISTLKIHRS